MVIKDFGWVYDSITHLRKKRVILFRCECGHEWETSTGSVLAAKRDGRVLRCRKCRTNTSKKCATTHGGVGTRLYRTWTGMKSRCLNPNNKSFKNYGGRGIEIQKEWLAFPVFRGWANSSGYSDSLTIERVDVNGNYCSDNCTWIPLSEQAKNTRYLKNPKTGEKYIYPGRKEGQYVVQVGRKSLGRFRNINDAIKCRDNFISTHLL